MSQGLLLFSFFSLIRTMAAFDPVPKRMRVVIVPGNGCSGDVRSANWYGWLEDELKACGEFSEVVLRTMPDPIRARERIWCPFLENECRCGSDTILVGHSSGAEAGMRLAETVKLAGLVLVSACHTDLGDAGERAAGYYSRPWRWADIRANCGFIAQFHSSDGASH